MEILKYFFALNPGSTFSYYIPVLVYCGLLIVGGYAVDFYIKKTKNENRTFKSMFGSLPKKLRWLGFITLFLLATRYENIPYFSMRIWLYLSLAVFLYLAGKYVYLFVKKYPSEKAFYQAHKARMHEDQDKKVYTMKKKKK